MTEFLIKADGNLNRMNAVNYVSDISVERGILSFAKKINADMIVTGQISEFTTHIYGKFAKENICSFKWPKKSNSF